MAFDFPSSPTVGQVVNGYTWDGEKWIMAGAGVLSVVKKNYVINGAMMVSQDGAAAGSTANYYPVDQFAYFFSGTTGVVSAAQVASRTPGGSPNRIRCTVTTADAAVAAGDLAILYTRLEGYRVVDLKFGTASAKAVTIQFGVKAPAGVYCVAIENGAPNRCYAAEYTITAGEANTDVIKSVTIPGDVTGTWLTDNGNGLQIVWTLMSGSTFQQAAGAWAAGNTPGTVNQFNLLGTNGNVFELFDVSLTEGTSAPAFVVPDYPNELVLCQRYYERSIEIGTTSFNVMSGVRSLPYSGGNLAVISERFMVNKRAAPTITLYSPPTGAVGKIYQNSVGDVAGTADNITTMSFRVYPTVSVTFNCYYQFSANARL